MNIIVTGGCGFIGSHIVDKLIENEHNVMVIDNLSTGKMKNFNNKAQFYKLDYSSKESEELIINFKPDVVYHHAAQVSVANSMSEPYFDAETNIMGTIKLLEYCYNAGVKKIIYPSSAAVYGNPEFLPINEEHPINPVSFYGISKYTPEQYIRVFCSQKHISFSILRYANVYGDRQDANGEGGVVSIFLDKYFKKECPTIYGDGNQTRDFIYIKDIVTANLLMLHNGENEVYNVSTGNEVSVNGLFSAIREHFNWDVYPNYSGLRIGDVAHSYLDNNKIRSLGWEPRYTIAEGINDISLNSRTFSELF
ncbi:NAD-dependent epimerase/dehydratase family protein [Paenibacillus sp. USHLN196]|uniref:NAD-dependent epimerase/dehydratase family protein n=1 Tax=Paenibacillus sp. USHLN196 TaxID=3081291 RepID=UPI00301A4247